MLRGPGVNRAMGSPIVASMPAVLEAFSTGRYLSETPHWRLYSVLTASLACRLLVSMPFVGSRTVTVVG